MRHGSLNFHFQVAFHLLFQGQAKKCNCGLCCFLLQVNLQHTTGCECFLLILSLFPLTLSVVTPYVPSLLPAARPADDSLPQFEVDSLCNSRSTHSRPFEVDSLCIGEDHCTPTCSTCRLFGCYHTADLKECWNSHEGDNPWSPHFPRGRLVVLALTFDSSQGYPLDEINSLSTQRVSLALALHSFHVRAKETLALAHQER